MSKRRLSDQQKNRIQRTQQQSVRNAGGAKDEGVELSKQQRGLVIARYSKHVDVKALEGEKKNTYSRCHVRANVDSIAVGDTVIWQDNERGEGVVVAVEPRRSLIERPDGMGKLKPVAANIDQVFVVFAAAPEPHPTLIDRYLIAAENSNIEAVLVFNKIDLLGEENPVLPLIHSYRALGYRVLEVSCHRHLGLAEMSALLVNKSSVFAGQSGVGKSSLVNAILPGIDTKVGELSDAVAKGKHTTTTASLFELPEGGNLIDSPGIREFHLNHYDAAQIYQGYREIVPLLGGCRFRDCRHQEEPDCVIKEFIASGEMSETRVASLQFILQSLAQS